MKGIILLLLLIFTAYPLKADVFILLYRHIDFIETGLELVAADIQFMSIGVTFGFPIMNTIDGTLHGTPTPRLIIRTDGPLTPEQYQKMHEIMLLKEMPTIRI